MPTLPILGICEKADLLQQQKAYLLWKMGLSFDITQINVPIHFLGSEQKPVQAQV